MKEIIKIIAEDSITTTNRFKIRFVFGEMATKLEEQHLLDMCDELKNHIKMFKQVENE